MPDAPIWQTWIDIAGKLRVPNALPGQSSAIWAERLAEFEVGRKYDPLSAEAFRYWRTRWWRGEEGRGRRLYHYLSAAVAQANGDADHQAMMPLGAARGLLRKGSWEPAETRSETWLATLPLFTRYRNAALIAADIIAWDPRSPEKWASRLNTFDALGQQQAELAIADSQPVRVYKTPQRWNRAGGPGAPGCGILDWEGDLGRMLLGGSAPALIGDDPEHARELKRRVDRARPKVAFIRARRTGELQEGA